MLVEDVWLAHTDADLSEVSGPDPGFWKGGPLNWKGERVPATPSIVQKLKEIPQSGVEPLKHPTPATVICFIQEMYQWDV